MNGETGDSNAPVRRSSRARKPNSRFADDELDGCFKKIVTGVTPPEGLGSAGSTPTRLKKGGKKRESELDVSDESSPTAKETSVSDGGIFQSPSKPNENVNGLMEEDESLADPVQSVSERRTRSNSKRDDSESHPAEEKKRGRKGSKGRSKGIEGESTVKSGSEKPSIDKISQDSCKVADFQVDAKQDRGSVKRENEGIEKVGASENINLKVPQPLRGKEQKQKHVKESGVPHDREEEQKILDENREMESELHAAASFKKVSEESSVVFQSHTEGLSRNSSNEDNQRTKGSLTPRSKHRDKFDSKEKEIPGLGSSSEAPAQDLGIGERNNQAFSETSSKFSETLKSSSVSSLDTVCKQLVDSESKSPSKAVYPSGNEHGQVYEGGKSPMASAKMKSRPAEDQSVGYRSEKVIFSAEDLLEPYSASPVSGVRVLPKENVDFSEAETSTPIGHKVESSTSKTDSNVPDVGRPCLESSSDRTSLPVPDRFPKESAAEAVAKEKPPGFSSSGKPVHGEDTGTSGNKPSSVGRRRGRSSKQSSKEVQGDDENTLKISSLDVAETDLPETSRARRASSKDVDPSGGNILDEKDSRGKNRTSQVSETEDVSSQVQDHPLEFGDEKAEVQDKDGFDDQGEDDVIRGKRPRSERESLSEEAEASKTTTPDSPKHKRRKENASALKQGGDQKRKLQCDPSEDYVKRKKKKSESDEAASSVATSVGRLPHEDASDYEKAEVSEGNTESAWGEKSDKASEPDVANYLSEMRKELEDPVKESSSESQVEEENKEIVEKRQSSLGSILSLLKRPDIAKNVEGTPDKKSKDDHRPLESSKGDRKRRDDDKEKEKRRKSTGDDIEKQKNVDVPSRGKYDDDVTRRRKDDQYSGEVSHKRDNQGKASNINDERSMCGSSKMGENLTWDSMKDADAGNFSWGSMKDPKFMENMTWGSMKDTMPVVPQSYESKKKTLGKKTVVSKPSSKATESDVTKAKSGEDEDDDAADRRSSSIGNILSFLKRSGQTPQQASKDKPQVSSEESVVPKTLSEEKIFSFVESSRKSLSVGRSESYSSYGKHSENDTPQKPSSAPKVRERKPSRWSAKEETVELPKPSRWPAKEETVEPSKPSRWTAKEETVEPSKPSRWSSKEEAVEPSKPSRWSAKEEMVEPSGSMWDGGAQVCQNIDVLASSRDNHGRSKWSEQRKPPVHSFKQWEKLPGVPPVREEAKDVNVPSEMSWSNPRSAWSSWSSGQDQRQFNPQYKSPEAEQLGSDSREPEKKVQESDDENLDFGNRAGLSEFIENYEEELNQSTDDSTGRNQQDLYQGELKSSAQTQNVDWPSKARMTPSPDRDLYMMPREKELDSPLRERAWSPKSNEIVLSPKSRELMSSLRNMEVKLTPHMEELLSSQSKPDPVVPPELNLFPLSSDVVSIPLPNEPHLPEQKQKDISNTLGMTEFASKSFETSQDENHSSLEGSWRGHTDRFKSHAGKFNIKTDPVKEEDQLEKFFEREKRGLTEEIHDDKENLEPKVEEKEFEDEKLEYQRKIQRDVEAKEERNRIVVEQRMKSFVHLKENLYLSDRKKSKRSKEVRRMVCDCSLSKEEISRGEVGCGEDCLNRLLMIEW